MPRMPSSPHDLLFSKNVRSSSLSRCPLSIKNSPGFRRAMLVKGSKGQFVLQLFFFFRLFPALAGTPRQCVEPATLDGPDTGGPGTKHDLWPLISAKNRGSKWFKHRTATHNMALFLSFVRLDSSYGKVRRGGGFNICLSLALPLSLHSSYRKGQKGFPSVTGSRHLMAR